MNRETSEKHVLIIGAGPAGLAAAVCLSRRNIRYTLLEQGPSVSRALREIDPEMTLLSPTNLSLMPEMDKPPRQDKYLSIGALIAALEKYQEKHRIRIVSGARVFAVTHDGRSFSVRYCCRDSVEHVLTGSHVINATGIISHPLLPSTFAHHEYPFRWMHSIDARAPDLKESRRLLVVGGGTSAADVLESWLKIRSTDAHAWLSLRSPLAAVLHFIFGLDVHYLASVPERIPTSLFGWRARRFREPMMGLAVRRAIGKGLITTLPIVKSYSADTVTFSNGVMFQPDLVVFATGFRYASEHLGQLVDYDSDNRPLVQSCESTRRRGLYLLGLRFGRTFASEFLRGIARDAYYVAERIARETQVSQKTHLRSATVSSSELRLSK